nr:histidine triad nucleotide-binding protein [Phytoactinopolyspora limicola]
MSNDDACLFCKIVAGDIPATVVRQSERTLSFRDIAPVSPTHVLVVPKTHYRDVPAVLADDPAIMAEIVSEAAAVAGDTGLEAFRIVMNTGEEAGQSVFHTHAHVLGGRRLVWPPG